MASRCSASSPAGAVHVPAQGRAVQRRRQQHLLQPSATGSRSRSLGPRPPLTELARHLQTAHEDQERGHLARDLHDELGAFFTSAKLDAARIRAPGRSGARRRSTGWRTLVDTLDGVALGRRIVEDLRPSTLGDLGLATTLDVLRAEFAERAGVKVVRRLGPVTLPRRRVRDLPHRAGPSPTSASTPRRAVWITLAEADGRVEVSVRNNSVGFDARGAASTYGLIGMRFASKPKPARSRAAIGARPGRVRQRRSRRFARTT